MCLAHGEFDVLANRRLVLKTSVPQGIGSSILLLSSIILIGDDNMKFGLLVSNIKITKPQEELTVIEHQLIKQVMKEQTK